MIFYRLLLLLEKHSKAQTSPRAFPSLRPLDAWTRRIREYKVIDLGCAASSVELGPMRFVPIRGSCGKECSDAWQRDSYPLIPDEPAFSRRWQLEAAYIAAMGPEVAPIVTPPTRAVSPHLNAFSTSTLPSDGTVAQNCCVGPYSLSPLPISLVHLRTMVCRTRPLR